MNNPRGKIVILFFFFLLVTPSLAEVTIPEIPERYVVDLAGMINADVETKLNNWLQELEEKTTAQVIVLTIPSLEGRDLEEFSIEVAHKKWRLGQKGKDNGVLLLVSLQDRVYRFEIGYGLEAILPDSLVGSIGRRYLIPYFRKGDYSTGIFYATMAIIKEIASDANVVITGVPLAKGQMPQEKVNVLESAFYIFVALLIIGMVCIGRGYPTLFFLGLPPINSRWDWGFGGGFGGGFGSFGGGGGGGFGGGGASGRW